VSNVAVKEGYYLRARLLVLERLGLDGADAHDCNCVRGVSSVREEEERGRERKREEEGFLSEE
jgi:hypothetical protein